MADDFNIIVGVKLSAEVTDDFFWSGELLLNAVDDLTDDFFWSGELLLNAVDDFFESGIF